MNDNRRSATLALTAALLLCACATVPAPPAPPPAPARPGSPALACESLSQAFQWPSTRVLTAEAVAEGAVKPPGITTPVPAHCRVVGRMSERTGPVDGKPYWIGFEMRLPTQWNGRFYPGFAGRL